MREAVPEENECVDVVPPSRFPTSAVFVDNFAFLLFYLLLLLQLLLGFRDSAVATLGRGRGCIRPTRNPALSCIGRLLYTSCVPRAANPKAGSRARQGAREAKEVVHVPELRGHDDALQREPKERGVPRIVAKSAPDNDGNAGPGVTHERPAQTAARRGARFAPRSSRNSDSLPAAPARAAMASPAPVRPRSVREINFIRLLGACERNRTQPSAHFALYVDELQRELVAVDRSLRASYGLDEEGDAAHPLAAVVREELRDFQRRVHAVVRAAPTSANSSFETANRPDGRVERPLDVSARREEVEEAEEGEETDEGLGSDRGEDDWFDVLGAARAHGLLDDVDRIVAPEAATAPSASAASAASATASASSGSSVVNSLPGGATAAPGSGPGRRLAETRAALLGRGASAATASAASAREEAAAAAAAREEALRGMEQLSSSLRGHTLALRERLRRDNEVRDRCL